MFSSRTAKIMSAVQQYAEKQNSKDETRSYDAGVSQDKVQSTYYDQQIVKHLDISFLHTSSGVRELETIEVDGKHETNSERTEDPESNETSEKMNLGENAEVAFGEAEITEMTEVSEDDDDSVADPTYEKESSSCEEENNSFPDDGHTVGDSIGPNPINVQHKERPRKGRKRKFEGQSRSDVKQKRNSNQPYYNYKGKHIASKEFNNFDCQCTLNCSEEVSSETRKTEFERFWSLKSYDSQNNFIAAGVTECEKKRNYGRNINKRKFSRIYRLKDKRVCREMYVKTLGITTFRVNTALKKFHDRAPLSDQRGVKQGGHNKLHEDKIQSIIDQINRIPRYISHYSRTQTEAEFLPPEITIQKMYNMYCEEQDDPVSFPSYKKIFYTKFNLKIKPLKKDTCNICDNLTMQIRNEADVEKKKILLQKHNQHVEEAEKAQKIRREDFQAARENEDCECLTFDLEKTLPLPRIPSNIVFYKRQLWLYNAGVHSGKEGRGYCYVWVEGTAGRGAQEVGSCLLRHIKSKLSPNVRHLILWSDSCGGQNRNIKLTLMLKSILHSTPQLETITLKFLYSGHSFLPNDSDFSDIESALKHQQRIYTPSEYIEVMKTCRRKKPLIVTEMSCTDFFGVKNLERKITNRKSTVDGEKINWLHIRLIKLEKSKPFSLFIKQHEFISPLLEISIKKGTRSTADLNSADIIFSDLISLWPNGKPIAEKKFQNLQELRHLIPTDSLRFYDDLKGDKNMEEDVDGFNVDHLDFIVEEAE